MGDLTSDFSLSEFHCRDGTKVPAKYLSNVRMLAQNLQVLRDHFGRKLRIISGYRSPARNANTTGAAIGSKHTLAQAADFTVEGIAPADVVKAIEELIKSGMMVKGGLGSYSNRTHYDVRGENARWSG